MTIITFGIMCWFVAIVCFSYVGIELLAEHEEYELWRLRIRTRAQNNYDILEYKEKCKN